ncbi:hypothetical protein DY000_02032856 [Brassica cretica]|uniref:Uncharacterized protein n=1 Tax=Brassica cretica TaxID=69181 RepID=A0ABQ7DX81_BRACR|nr:hypothetical protein DY000_02032856 [Brassica cretica]
MLMSSIVTESESIVYWLIVHTIKDWVVEPAREGSYKSRCCKRDGYIVSFEGRRRTVRLRKGLQHSGDNVDTLIVIPNDMLLTAVSLFRLLFQKHSIWQMICFVKGYRGISDNITIPGLVNVDFADVRAIMANAGSSLMGVGTATATGFKRQEEGERKPLQGTQVDASMGVTRRSSSSFTEGSSIEIPDFLKKKGRSCYPRL